MCYTVQYMGVLSLLMYEHAHLLALDYLKPLMSGETTSLQPAKPLVESLDSCWSKGNVGEGPLYVFVHKCVCCTHFMHPNRKLVEHLEAIHC